MVMRRAGMLASLHFLPEPRRAVGAGTSPDRLGVRSFGELDESAGLRGVLEHPEVEPGRRRRGATLRERCQIRAALGRRWVAKERARRMVYSWTIRTPAERETAQVHADALIWEADGRP